MHFAAAASFLHHRFHDLDPDTKRRIIHVSAGVAGLIAVRKVYVYASGYLESRRTRQRKLDQTRSTKGKLLQKLVGLKKPIENKDALTDLSYAEVRERLQNNDLTATDLLEAHQAKALEVDRRLNCVTDMIYDADVTSLYVDGLDRDRRGRLHGIPLSLKECLKLADYDTYYGCVSECFKPEKEHAVMVEALIREGMVPFARTNMAQFGCSASADNALFGETVNPYDEKRTCGGSSGGEGALVGAGGSMVGLGTDIGGSVRIPSHSCGVFGFKPSQPRVGRQHMGRKELYFQALVHESSVGPISRDLDLLVDVMRVIFSPTFFDLDVSVPRLHFNEDDFDSEEPMTIGYYTSFESNPYTPDAVPAVARAVDEVRVALERRGHKLVEWQPPRISYACGLCIRNLFIDGGEIFKRFGQSEYWQSKEIQDLVGAPTLKPWPKFLLAHLVRPFNPMFGNVLLNTFPPRSVFDLLALADEMKAYKEECNRSWVEAGLDGVICPVMPYAAPLLGDTAKIFISFLYTGMYNFLDYPAGVVPVTKVTDEDIDKLQRAYPRTITGCKVIATQETSKGMPVAVQCVAMTLRDEKALRLMKEVKEAIE